MQATGRSAPDHAVPVTAAPATPAVPRSWPVRAGWIATSAALLVGGIAPADAQAADSAVVPSAPNAAVAARPLDAAGLIQRIQAASNRQSYIGTFVVNVAGSMSSSRITHVVDGSDQVDRIESLDGPMRQVFRHNDRVHVLWPRSRTATVEPRDLGLALPTAWPLANAGALEMYEVQPAGADRIAGLDADVVRLRPRDALRHGQRLWLDRRTGLLLRTDLIGAQGEVIESAAFSELHLDSHLQVHPLLADMNRLRGYVVTHPQRTLTELDHEGWRVRQPIAGFRLLHSYRHQQGIAGASEPTPSLGTGPAVVQAVYSDGLVTVSVFIEPYQASQHHADLPPVAGATQAHGRRVADWWITAVGDVPVATLQQFAAQIEPKDGRDPREPRKP